MPNWTIEGEDAPKSAGGWKIEDEPSAPPSDGFQPTQYGFKVKPIDLGNGKQSVQREDGAVYFGPDQGNKGKPGWFNDKGLRLGSKPGEDSSIRDRAINDMLLKTREVDSKPLLGRIIPPAVSSVAQGGIEAITAPAQYLGHKMGITAMDKPMDEFNRFNQETFVQDPVARGMGAMALPTKAIGNAPLKASQQVSQLLQALKLGKAAAPIANVATAAATGRVAAQALTPEYDIQNEQDYEARKNTEGNIGMALGGIPAAAVESGLVGKAVQGGQRIVNAIKNKGEDFAPATVVNWFKNRVPGKASDVLQEDLQQQYAAARARGSAPFQELRTQDGTVSMQPYIDKVDAAIGEVQKSGFSDKEPIIQQLTALKKTAQEGPMTWGKAMDIGTDINDKISQAMSGMSPDRNLARILQPIKSAHQEALDLAGSQFGDKYKLAKQAWIDNVVPWEDPKQGGRLLKNFMNSPTPDQAMNALLKAKSEDKIDIFVKQLSKDKGIPALQAGLVDAVYQQSLDEAGKVIPAKFLGALKARQDAYGLSFTGEAKWRMDGLATLLRDAKFTAQFLTGEFLRHIPGGRILPGSAFPTPDAGSLLQKIFTSPMGSKFLLQAQGMKANSPQLANLMDAYLPKIIGASAGTGTASNVSRLRPTMPAAASTEPNSTLAENQP